MENTKITRTSRIQGIERIKNNRDAFLPMRQFLNFYFFLFILSVSSAFYFHMRCDAANAQPYSSLVKYSFKNRLYTHRLAIKSDIIYKLNTALGYVSIITLPCIPLNVAIGSASDFSEQIVGKQIFIKPMTYNSKINTNLEILTKYGLINVLLKITKPKYVTYDLNLTQRVNNVFVTNYIKTKIKKDEDIIKEKYSKKLNLLDKERSDIKKQKKEILNIVLSVNKIKINKKIRKKGIVLTINSLSRIGKIYYLQYQLTNTTDRKFFIRNVYLFLETGGNFFSGYNPTGVREIMIMNQQPHNKQYMPYKIIRNVAVFKVNKKYKLKLLSRLKFSVHILLNKKLVKLNIGSV
ncbi:MAG: hypothetical protein EVJ46_08085 [Candidatus Acididesulfobacter guangdongensis]|uniref:DUF4138 domain-containing protein n=1 Tax=Acididesulfobacter guangdongensis TaxID=2597225 RepID=A0A519BFU8_ACIG2|nr:MAG: hypothetical protein EVJ46_08085 [Candidatus Acididesulfobacter guangdongensis]